MRRKGIRRSVMTLLAAVMASCLTLAAGSEALADGEVIRSGSTGDCTYKVIKEEPYNYSFLVSGQGAMEDYQTKGDYRMTEAPWGEDLHWIKRVEAEEGVTTIGKNAFSSGLSGCYIEKVTLPDSVESVKDGAFYKQYRLKEVQFGDGLTRIGEEAFFVSALSEVHFPTGLKTIDTRAFGAGSMSKIEIPDSVTYLGVSAFRENMKLNTVIFGSGTSLIRRYSFYACSNLTTLVIPATVTEIDENAFKDCNNIQHIYYGGTSDQLNALKVGANNGSFNSADVTYGLVDCLYLSSDKPVAGTKLTVRFTSGDESFDLETPSVRWQRSWNGTTGWTDLTGTVDAVKGENYYEVQKSDENYYIRAIVTKDGFSGETVTDKVKVLDGISLDTFSDENLRSYIGSEYDKDGNQHLTVDEIEQITTLSISGLGIKSLYGIRYLSDLQHLYAYRNDISYADFYNMNSLVTVDLSDNKNLQTVRLKGCLRLENLDLEGSGIKTVNLSDNPELRNLGIYETGIGKIDIRSNPYLVEAALYGTKKEESIFDLYYTENGSIALLGGTPLVVSIDAKHFPSECFRNMILDRNYDWDGDGILSMWEARDVKVLAPEDSEEQVTTLEGIEYFPELTYLSSFNCRISEVDLSRNKKLESLYLGGNCLTELDVSMLSELKELDVSYNEDLLVVDVFKNLKLEQLYCWGCGLGMLDLSRNSELQILGCGENQIGRLDVRNLSKLEDLECGTNPLQSLDLSKNKKLKILRVSDTEIKNLNLLECPELIMLSCENLGLTKLDISANPKLFSLYCKGNAIKKLDIGVSERLRSAYAGTKSEKTDPETGKKGWSYMSAVNSSWIMEIDQETKISAEPVKTGTWKKDKKGWWYRYDDGTYPKNEWVRIAGKWYHFNAEGYMQTGWLKLDGKWYYLKPATGEMATGWLQVGSDWYYLNPSNGTMVTGWKKLGGKWYYLNPATGIMAIGWQRISGKWYFFAYDGEMMTGWQQIEGKWYFFRDGVMVNGWQKITGKWYYFNEGVMVTGSRAIDGKWYQFDENGVCLNP